MEILLMQFNDYDEQLEHTVIIYVTFQTKERELKPNGKKIPVTNLNKKEYVE